MKKIPTLFRRDPDDMRRLLPEVTPGCEWVLAGEGTATRKYDGICLMMDGQGDWWARREVKLGKEPPDEWVEVDHDLVTGKRYGWEPVEQTGWGKYLDEALEGSFNYELGVLNIYELCGPKVNRNPEGYEKHTLVRHADAQTWGPLSHVHATDYPGFIRAEVRDLGDAGWEGIVWHHSDGRMAKLKARDLR